MFLRRRRTNSLRTGQIENIKTSVKSKVLLLRPHSITIEFNKKGLRDLFSKKKFYLGYGGVAVITLLVISFSFSSHANIATFYPATCLGGWEYPSNAEGIPSLSEDAKESEYNEDNSARLRGNAEIYCGGFEGEVPENMQVVGFKVAFNISLDDGSVDHDKSEAKKIIDGESLDVDTTSSEAQDPTVITEDPQEALDVIQKENIPTDDPDSEPEDDQPQTSDPVESDTQESDNVPSEEITLFHFTEKAFAEDVVVEEVTPQQNAEPQTESLTETESESEAEPETQTETEIEPELEAEVQSQADTQSGEQVLDTATDDSDSNLENQSTEEATVEPSSAPEDAILKALYSLDGSTWESFGYIRMNGWEKTLYPLPISDWNDLSKIQIKLEVIEKFDKMPVIYLDSVIIEVEYAGEIPEDTLAQPDFSTDIVLSDSTVEDIRVIKILREGVPMIWYTKLIPLTAEEALLQSENNLNQELPLPTSEDSTVVETIQIIGVEDDVPTEDILIDVPVTTEDPAPAVEEDPITEDPTPIIEEVPVTEDIVTPSTNEVTVLNKIKSLFGLHPVYAEEGATETSGDTSDSSSSGDEVSVTSDSSTEPEVEANTDTNTDIDPESSSLDLNIDEEVPSEDQEINEENTQSDFDSVPTPGEGVIIINNFVNENIPQSTQYFDDENIPIITTTEEIVPGVIPIIYTDEQIQAERAKGLEWNFVASGDTVDIATPVDVSGTIIFWLSRDKTAINQYNTASGGMSSQSISTSLESEVKYLEPNGDVSEIAIDPANLEIVTPLEEKIAEEEALNQLKTDTTANEDIKNDEQLEVVDILTQ